LGPLKDRAEIAAARYVGPVHELWGAYAKTEDLQEIFNASTLTSLQARDSWLRPRSVVHWLRMSGRTAAHPCRSLQGLSLSMLELLLRSEHLIVNSEEDTYALITAWADGHPGGEQEAAFNRLWPCLRLHHMSPIFLASVVAERKSAAKISHRYIFEALAYQGISASLDLAGLDVDPKSRFMSLPPSRAPKDPAPYLFRTEVVLADCAPLEIWKVLAVVLGVAAGYRVCFQVHKAGEPATLGLYVGLGALSPVARAAVPGPIVRVRIQAGEMSLTSLFVFKLGSLFGSSNFFSEPWEEVVRDGSPHFPQGRLSVKISIQFLTDKHVEPTVSDLPQAN
jgi:hypothetical protein